MRQRKTLKNIARFLPYLKSQWKRAFLAGIFMLISVLLQLPLPLITRHIIDNILPNKDIVLLNWVILGLIGFMLIKGVSDLLNGYLLTLFRERVLFDIQLKLFQHIQKLNLSFFKNKRIGYLMSRIRNDVSNLQGLLAQTLLSFLRDSLTFIVGTTVIFIFHWKLASASLAVLPFFVYSIHFFSGRIRKKSLEFQEKIALVSATLQETLSAISIVKSFQLEKYEARKYVKKLRELIRTRIRFDLLSSFFGYTTAFIGGIGPLIVLWYGGREVIRGNLTLGTLVAFSAFLGYLFGPAQRLMNLNTNIQKSLASLERVFELLDIAPKINEPDKPKKFELIEGRVKFDNITFSYNSSEPVLKNVNLIVEPGKTVALVGKSGAGKTSLVNLIPRFYDPQQGNIFIDGINIKEVRIQDLRKAIGIVPQETFLFSGTIKENIKYGRLNASDEEIIEAAKLANADEFIRKLPQGYDTEIGERGMKLSGGQRQRIAIARVILKDPKILILDEATSELDAESEKLIQDALRKLCKNRTTFIIAHRFSTIINVDKIIVLDNGRIIGKGIHNELYQRCEYYRELCKNQLISQDIDFDKDSSKKYFPLIPPKGKSKEKTTRAICIKL
ncbi:MAG: ABC transporter ATP-binding protein [Candidatus Aminicenantia bacterium]